MSIHPEFTPIEANEIWQFPMHYPMKMIGDSHVDFRPSIETILLSHFPEFDVTSIEEQPSSSGKYTSLRVKLYFETAEQVNAIYNALRSNPFIKTVL